MKGLVKCFNALLIALFNALILGGLINLFPSGLLCFYDSKVSVINANISTMSRLLVQIYVAQQKHLDDTHINCFKNIYMIDANNTYMK